MGHIKWGGRPPVWHMWNKECGWCCWKDAVGTSKSQESLWPPSSSLPSLSLLSAAVLGIDCLTVVFLSLLGSSSVALLPSGLVSSLSVFFCKWTHFKLFCRFFVFFHFGIYSTIPNGHYLFPFQSILFLSLQLFSFLLILFDRKQKWA